ncbi:MAG: hypothetical protein WBD28_12605 [Candidatus Zixiibacteriota bacterium]
MVEIQFHHQREFNQIQLGLLTIATIVIIAEYTIRKAKHLVKTAKELVLQIIKSYYEIKALKKSHNPFHKQIKQKDTRQKQYQSSLRNLMFHKDNMIETKEKRGEEKKN